MTWSGYQDAENVWRMDKGLLERWGEKSLLWSAPDQKHTIEIGDGSVNEVLDGSVYLRVRLSTHAHFQKRDG